MSTSYENRVVWIYSPIWKATNKQKTYAQYKKQAFSRNWILDYEESEPSDTRDDLGELYVPSYGPGRVCRPRKREGDPGRA